MIFRGKVLQSAEAFINFFLSNSKQREVVASTAMVYRVGAGTSPFMPNSAGGKLACAGTFLPILFPCKYRKAKIKISGNYRPFLKTGKQSGCETTWQAIRQRKIGNCAKLLLQVL
ncbi:hypothetical protein [Gaoshiqia sediminis]|uniref:Uncharacterized protein n=1 Tax=Gaoshiqia sediminis TaxID=2986998 RepID=A0AA41Y7X7_9BACT|nr:hypothetical protein [Gaoshiqia sediminis]MCW0485054.1 hypothetical protein [Gaoshiqia sediminis]